MRYFNRDYVNFVVSDEKEAQLIKEKGRAKSWRLDPALRLEYQKKIAGRGNLVVVLWLIVALLHLALAAYYYFNRTGMPIITLLYIMAGVGFAAVGALYYRETMKARAEIRKTPDATKS